MVAVETKDDEHGSPCEGAWDGQSMAKDAVRGLRTASSATVLIGTRGAFVYMHRSVEGGGEKAVGKMDLVVRVSADMTAVGMRTWIMWRAAAIFLSKFADHEARRAR